MEGYEDELTIEAFTTKGLEFIAEREIRNRFPEAKIESKRDKRVIFRIKNARLKELFKLKTVDDIQLLLKEFNKVKELSEQFILENTPSREIEHAITIIKQLRPLSDTFSLTLSKYKNSSIDLYSLQQNFSKKITSLFNLGYTERDHKNFDLRIHIEASNLFFSCRIPRTSLYSRRYKICKRKGALKSTIAASLCMMLSSKKGERLVDDFCGSGTILCEALLQGFEPFGGDIDTESVECARTNIRALSKEHVKNVRPLDATSTRWQNNYFDYAVSNYPWGKQIPLNGMVKLYENSIREYARILKKDGSVVLLGINPDLIVKYIKKYFSNHLIEKFKIGFLGQTPWVVYASPAKRKPL